MENLNKYEDFINEGWFTDFINNAKQPKQWKDAWGKIGKSTIKEVSKKVKTNPNFSKSVNLD